MDRFRKPSLIAAMLLLTASMTVTSVFAYGRLPGRGIESGGDENPEQTLVGEPDWGGGGRPNGGAELDLHVRAAVFIALKAIGINFVWSTAAPIARVVDAGEQP